MIALNGIFMVWQEVSPMMNFLRRKNGDASIRTKCYLMQNLNKQIEENKSLRARENSGASDYSTCLCEGILASAKSYNTTLMEMYNDLKARWNAIWQEPDMKHNLPLPRQLESTSTRKIDHMSCSADTYVSLGGSNGCADQLTNRDGTQKVELGNILQKKEKGLGR